MSIKKILTLAAMALALVAVAAPSASATWTENHEAITANKKITFAGHAGFKSEAGFTTCKVHGTVEAKAESTTGTLIEFTIFDHDDCSSEGALENCIIDGHPTVTNETSGEPISEDPAIVHIEETDNLTITDLTIDTDYTDTEDCEYSHNQLHVHEATLEPEPDATTIDGFDITGTAELTLGVKALGGFTVSGGTVELFDTVDVSPTETWGIDG